MGLANIWEHEKCHYYDQSENEVIEVLETPDGNEDSLSLSHNEIVFVLEGKIRFLFPGHAEKEIGEGQFIFIPAGIAFRYKAERKSMALVIHLHDRLRLCPGFIFEQLYGKVRLEGTLKPEITIAILDINTPLWNYLDGLTLTLADGLKCRHFFDVKIQEVFILLRAYYTRESLSLFFSPVLSSDTAFSEYIRTNVMRFRTVRDFAASMKLTEKRFTTRFKRVFNEPPYGWMKREKAKMIYDGIVAGQKDNKHLVYEYGFSSTSQFYDFCKDNFGKTPSEIRNRENSDK